MFATPKCRFFSFFFWLTPETETKSFTIMHRISAPIFGLCVSTLFQRDSRNIVTCWFPLIFQPPGLRLAIGSWLRASDRRQWIRKTYFCGCLKHQRIEIAKRALLINPAGASKISIYAKPELKLQIATSSWCMISQHLFYFSHILRLANEINCSKFEYSFFTPATLCWGLAGFWCLLSYVCESIFIQLSGCFCEESDITIKKETSLANQWIQN